MDTDNELKQEEIPEELYAPIGNVSFTKPNDATSEELEPKKEEVEPEILSYKDVKLEYAKKPFNVKKFVTTIFVIIVIALFSVAFYLYQINNKNILRIGVSNLANTFEDSLYGIKGSQFLSFSLDKPFRTSILLSFDTIYDETKLKDEEIEFLKTMNDVTISETLDMDYTNQQFTHNLKATYLGGNIIDIYGNANKDGFTYKIKDVLGKYIFYPIDNFERFYLDPNDDQKEFSEIKNIVLTTLFSNIQEEDLTREKKTLKIGKNNIQVKDVSLKMSNDYIKNLLKNTISDLKENEEFQTKVMSYTNLTSTRLKELIEELETNISNTTFVEEDLIFHIYAKGITNKIVGYKLNFTNQKKYEIEYLSYKTDLSLNISQNNETYLRYTKDTSVNDEYRYTLKYLDNDLTMTQTEQDGNILYEYTLNQNKDEYYTGSIITTDERNKTTKDGNIRLTITKFNKQKEELFNFYITLNYNIKTMEVINLYDDDNMAEYDTLTEDDKKEIIRRIEATEYFDLVKSKIEAYKNLVEKKS